MYDFNCMSHRNFPHLRNYRAKEYFEHFVPSVYAVLFQLFSPFPVFLPLPFLFLSLALLSYRTAGLQQLSPHDCRFSKIPPVSYATFYHCFPPFSRSYLFNMYKNSNICDKIRIFIRKSF